MGSNNNEMIIVSIIKLRMQLQKAPSMAAAREIMEQILNLTTCLEPEIKAAA